jgi:ParB-like chromosome segregation protein Spo0J
MGLLGSDIVQRARELFAELDGLDDVEKIDCLNDIREILHKHSPFRNEPVDLVRWIKADVVRANDYNPNTVAPPEMRLLAVSILHDGYTQPVVSNAEDDGYVVVDGFHRSRVGKENKDVRKRVLGYLPVVQIRPSQVPIDERMASTIRHNRARGRHGVDSMSKVVSELAKKAWTDEKIAKELGMDPDEVLRLKQITGLADLFADREFSNAWEIDEKALSNGIAEQPCS